MHDVEAVGAFRQRVLRREHVDLLRHEPVVARELQRHAVLARAGGRVGGVQRDALAARALHALSQRDRRGGDEHVLFGRPRQHHAVAVDDELRVRRGGVLEYADRPDVLRDHHGRLVVVGDVCGDVLHEDRAVGRVVAVDRIDHQAAVALQVVAHHGDRGAVAAADVERVAAQAADDLERHARAGALDEEAVVAFQRVDHDALEAGVGDEQARAVHALVVHHEVVAELGADYRQRVEAVAAVDAHRGVHGEGDEVGALPAVDVGERRLRIVRVDLDEGAHGEGVVILVAEQEQLRLVAVDGEVVAPRAAEDGGALAHAVGQEAARDLRGLEVVLLGEAVVRIAAVAERLVHLADLEGVVAGVAEDGGRREVVVEDERVVAVAAEDLHRAADVGVVVDALDHAARHRHAVGVDLDRRHHALPDRLVGAQQEEVRLVGAIDAQAVDARIAARLVEDVDARGDLAGKPDLVAIRALLAVQRELAVDAAHEGLVAVRVEVDPDHVVAVAGVDGHRARGALDVDHVVGAVHHRVLVAGVEVGDAGMRRLDEERVVAVGQPDLQHFEAGVADAERHAHAGELVGAHPSAFLGGVARVVHAQAVAVARLAGDGEARVDVVHAAGEGIKHAAHRVNVARRVADAHDVAACAAADGGVAGDGLDVDDVRAAAARQRGHRTGAEAVRAQDGEHIAGSGVAQMDLQRFERAVGDAAIHIHQPAEAADAVDNRRAG